jgi:hypothetical protein
VAWQVREAELVVPKKWRFKAKSLEPLVTPSKRVNINALGLLDVKRTQSENESALADSGLSLTARGSKY